MAEIRTDKALLDALHKAASHRLSACEVQQQRVSFILGSLKDTSTVTRERVTEILAEHEGRRK